MENRDIVVVGLQPLDMVIGSNCVNIAYEFAKKNRVLYVNYAFDRTSLNREKNKPEVQKRLRMMKGKQDNLQQIQEGLWNLYPDTVLESINWIPITQAFRMANFINNKRFAREIKKAIKRLGFKDFLLFNDSDMFRSFFLNDLLKPACSVYYTRDNMLSVPYWKKHGKTLEPELMKKCDLVCANSTYLKDLASEHNPNSFFVGQGCDVSAFNKDTIVSIPSDLLAIPGPRIGYIGALYTLRLDIEILNTIALSHPEWSVVLIGPEDNDFKSSNLHQLKNVYFLGLKDGAELPSYLAGFDVALNPQILNETTIGNYPRKIDEYLAMGKPTVATETKAMSIFAEHTYLAKSKEDYPGLIELALKENSSEKEQARITFAQSHTWENSVQAIYQAIQQVKPQF
jgi:glycosyltransferase involved in cell wall biosynthesis